MGRKKPDLRILGLGDPSLMSRLQEAAEAAGLESVEQLADLIVDSGVAARPPQTDPLSERLTLEDLGERLRLVSCRHDRTEREEWFANLAPTQKTALITTLRARGYSAIAISNDFGVDQIEVEKTYAQHTTKLGEMVLGVRLDTLAGQIFEAKQRAQQLAAEKGDGAGLWRIEKEFAAVMQDLGVLERAAHRVEVVNKAEEAKGAAMQRLVELAEKQAARNAELAVSHSERLEIEMLPPEVEAAYEEARDG